MVSIRKILRASRSPTILKQTKRATGISIYLHAFLRSDIPQDGLQIMPGTGKLFETSICARVLSDHPQCLHRAVEAFLCQFCSLLIVIVVLINDALILKLFQNLQDVILTVPFCGLIINLCFSHDFLEFKNLLIVDSGNLDAPLMTIAAAWTSLDDILLERSMLSNYFVDDCFGLRSSEEVGS